jgi:hypothetical protein
MIAECVNQCKLNASKLRSLANSSPDNDLQKLLLIAAHHLDVSVAELDYIIMSATVPT